MPDKTYRPRAQVAPIVRELEKRLPGSTICGSWRRGAEQVGDVDVLIQTETGELPDLGVLAGLVVPASGAKKAGSGHVDMGDGKPPLQVDVYACTAQSRGAFLWFLTGPKNLNIRMRSTALGMGWKLSQYGLLTRDGEQVDDGTEQSVASWLGVEELLDPRTRQQFASPLPTAKAVEVIGSKGDVYVVKIDGDRASCTCPGFRFRRACKHVERVKRDIVKV